MIDHGFLALFGDLDGLETYWQQLLRDFPNHPAFGQEARSMPLTLYGPSTEIGFVFWNSFQIIWHMVVL